MQRVRKRLAERLYSEGLCWLISRKKGRGGGLTMPKPRIRLIDVTAVKHFNHMGIQHAIYLYQIGNQDTEAAVDALAAVAKEGTPELSKAAVYALGNSDSPKARQVLIDILSSTTGN